VRGAVGGVGPGPCFRPFGAFLWGLVPVLVPFRPSLWGLVPVLPLAPVVGSCYDMSMSSSPVFRSVGFAAFRRSPSAVRSAAAAAAVAAVGRGASLFVPAPAGRAPSVASSVLAAVPPSAVSLFSVSFSGPGALPARAAAALRALASAPAPVLLAWPGRPCPSSLAGPSRSWVSCGSGSWSEIALALGLGVPVVLFGAAPPPWVSVGRSWSAGPLAGGVLLLPSAPRLL